MNLKILAPLMLAFSISPAAMAVNDTTAPPLIHAKGSILSHNTNTNELVILINDDGDYHRLTYSLDNETSIMLNGKIAALKDLQYGDVAKLEYTREGEKRTLLNVAAYETENALLKQANAKANEPKNILLIVEKPKTMFRSADNCEVTGVKTIEFVTIPPKEASMTPAQEVTVAASGTMELYPKANGKFIRQKRLNEDAFVVSFKGRWVRHRKTFHLDHDAIVYQGTKLTKLDFLQRGDPVEVAFMDTGKKYVALEVESNRTGEYVATNRIGTVATK